MLNVVVDDGYAFKDGTYGRDENDGPAAVPRHGEPRRRRRQGR